MFHGEYEASRSVEQCAPGFCVRGVGWGVLHEHSGDGDEEEKWCFYLQYFVHMHRPTAAEMSTVVHDLAQLHTMSEDMFDELTRHQRLEGARFGFHVPTHNGHLA
jgi:hypothetical protein